MCGVRERFGFPTKGSEIFLNRPVQRSRSFKQHRAEDWQDLAVALGWPEGRAAAPALQHASYRSERIARLLAGVDKPVICLHTGARIPVRRWPESYFQKVLEQIRREFDFHLVLVPDPDGYGSGLAKMADSIAADLNITELVDILGSADVLLCNDSAPAHVAAACGRPAIAIFGPTDPDWFRPWGEDHHVVIRDICEYRPCFDYCRFPEPYCMTKLLPDDAYPEIREHLLMLIRACKLPSALLRCELPPV
jgi:ADP-heptose:LPS heptosyltransferase